MASNFDLAIKTVLANEGGYVWDENDPGGETNYGISKASYPDVDIKNLSLADATAIYRRDFWLFEGIINQAIATKIFDSYVNMRHAAIRIAQKIVGAIQDGQYGLHTEAAINAFDPTNFLFAFRIGLVGHYSAIVAANPSEQKFLAGWLRRANQ